MPNDEQGRSRRTYGWLLVLLTAGFLVAHHDVWLWHDRRLVLGAVPVGLAYHAAYSLAACGLIALVARFGSGPD